MTDLGSPPTAGAAAGATGPQPGDRLPLPGPRALWWLVALVAVALPAASFVHAAVTPHGDAQTAIRLEVRERNLLYRARSVTAAGQLDGADRSGSRTVEVAHVTTGQATIAPLAAVATATADPAGGPAAKKVDRSRDRLREAERERRAREQALIVQDLRELFAAARRADAEAATRPATADAPLHKRTAELVVAHAVGTRQDALAASLAVELGPGSPDLRAALAALPDSATATATGWRDDLGLPPAEAAVASRDRGFGSAWSPWLRDRVRARVLAAAGDLKGARRLNQHLQKADLPVLAAFLFVVLLAALGGLVGVGMWLVGLARIGAARGRGEPPLGWLRARYRGLAHDRPYPADPLVPFLGFGMWMLGTVLAQGLVAALPGPPMPRGLAVLFQTCASLLLAHAVLQAFSRAQPPLQGAIAIGPAAATSFWRASTAALRAWSVLLPVMAVVMLVTVSLTEVRLHPIQRSLLDGGDPLQLAAMGVAAVVVGPLVEEMVLRGFVYRWVRQRHGIAAGLLASSLLFSLLHLSPEAALPYAVLGLAFALVYEWVGSLWAAVILHGLWNGVVFVLMAAVIAS